jgi:hypothetical protein
LGTRHVLEELGIPTNIYGASGTPMVRTLAEAPFDVDIENEEHGGEGEAVDRQTESGPVISI